MRTLAAQRSPDSYIAGGIAINRRNPGAPRGYWPSSTDIERAMLERYGGKNP